jgi:hypothetical protein
MIHYRAQHKGHVTRNTGRRTQNAERRTQDAGRRTQDAGRRTQNAERRTQIAKRKTQNAKRRTQNAEWRTQDAGRRVHPPIAPLRPTHQAPRLRVSTASPSASPSPPLSRSLSFRHSGRPPSESLLASCGAWTGRIRSISPDRGVSMVLPASSRWFGVSLHPRRQTAPHARQVMIRCRCNSMSVLRAGVHDHRITLPPPSPGSPSTIHKPAIHNPNHRRDRNTSEASKSPRVPTRPGSLRNGGSPALS